jgi:excisionase family DNA binding protein
MKNHKTAPSYLSTTQAAQRLGLSVGTIQRMVEAGVLQAYTTQGGHRRILSSSLNQYCRGAAGNQEASIPLCVLTTPEQPCADRNVLEQIAGLQWITNPLELVGLRHHIRVLFLDARIPWLPWDALHLADSLGTNAQCIVYNSQLLPDTVQAALLTQAALHPGDLSADLVRGYLLGHATRLSQAPHATDAVDPEHPEDLASAHH